MYNKVILMGRLTKDPELRTTPNGVSVCRFSIAVDRGYTKPGEERKADFFDITAWRQTGEFVNKYFSKGRCILIEGTIENNNYTDQNNVKHYTDRIVADRVFFTGEKRQESSYGGGEYVPPAQNAAPSAPAPRTPSAPKESPQADVTALDDFEEIISDGELPF